MPLLSSACCTRTLLDLMQSVAGVEDRILSHEVDGLRGELDGHGHQAAFRKVPMTSANRRNRSVDCGFVDMIVGHEADLGALGYWQGRRAA